MVYSNKFVMAVIQNDHAVSESNHFVKVAFGSEYSLRFKNKNNRRAVVKIFIDGEEVSGNGYIIPAHGTIDIKRHYHVDRAFKFVSLDSEEAVEFGKNGPNHDKMKGTIEARFYLEREYQWSYPAQVHHHHHYDVWPKISNPYRPTYPSKPCGPIWVCDEQKYTTTEEILRGEALLKASNDSSNTSGELSAKLRMLDRATTTNCSSQPLSFNFSTPSAPAPSVELKDGCTVEGTSTGQGFELESIAIEDNYTQLFIYLQGYEAPVNQVVCTSKKGRKSNPAVDELEAENERLRRKLAELENEKLKQKIKDLEG